MNILAEFTQTPPEAASGIYLFISNNRQTVYYVGQSKNIRNRYNTHAVKQFLKSKSIAFNFIWKQYDTSQLNSKEAYYIKQTSPVLNTLLNEHIRNSLKSEYQDFIRKSIEREVQIITINLKEESELNKQSSKDLQKSLQKYINVNSNRVYTLLKCIEIGSHYYQLKQMFLSAPNKDTQFITDMGTFTGWYDFLEKQGLARQSIDRYIFMYEHQQEFEELKLLSTDPEDIANGASGHRKIAACEAVRWYLKLIAEKGDSVRGTVTAADYQAHKSNLAKKGAEAVDTYPMKLEQYFSLLTELQSLRKEVEVLRCKLATK